MQQLHELAKLDTYWRKLALKMCGCPILADDIVQDMYLKVAGNPPPKWNKRYIYRVLNSVFIDHIRKQRGRINIEDIELSFDPSEHDTDDLVNKVQKGISYLDEDAKLAVLTNMDNTVRATANKMGYSAYKLWSKNKAIKDELREDTNLKAAYELLKKGEL